MGHLGLYRGGPCVFRTNTLSCAQFFPKSPNHVQRMRLRIIYFLFCLTPCFTFAQNTPIDLQTALSNLEAAETAHHQQRYSDALPLAVSAYGYFKTHGSATALPQSAYQLARTQYALQQYDTAQVYFLEAAKYFPQPSIPCGDAWHYAGRCAMSSDRLTDAEHFFSKGLEITV